jgi:hypothetical protein
MVSNEDNLFNFVLEYPIRKAQETLEGVTVSVTLQFLVYAEDINLFSENTNTTTKNINALDY